MRITLRAVLGWLAAMPSAVAVAGVVAVAAPGTSAMPAACVAPQRAVFACPVGGRQLVVCATDPLSATEGALQYRYGPADAAELVLPAPGADWRAGTRSGTLMFSGGGGAYLAFASGRYRYVVYTAVLRGSGPRAGLVVERDGRLLSSRRCSAPALSSLGPGLFEQAGVPADERGFELP